MSPPRIDVHLLTLDEPQHWREECLASLAGAPIRLHLLPGIPGRVGRARAAGFARGTLPLVACASAPAAATTFLASASA